MLVLHSRYGCFTFVVALWGLLIIALGFFVDIPVWLVYSAAVIVMLAMLLLTGSNIIEQILRKRAGKSVFPKRSWYGRLFRIIQAIMWFSLSIRFISHLSLDPISLSKYPSYSVAGMLMIAVSIMLLIIVQYTYPQIAEHGIFDLQGKFYVWSDIESFVWESYAKRLVFKIKGELYQKIVVDNIPSETYSEIYPHLERHLHHTQAASQ